MKTDSLPQKSFERNMNHNYMILNQPNFFHEQEEEQDYRVRMLLDNKIEGLLPVSGRTVNGESKYYYEINSLQSMDRVYAKEELDYQQLCTLLQGCIHLYDSLEEYLLDGSQVILKPEYIYLNMDSMEPYFVYFPEYESNARDSFASFIEELLRKVDHTDEQAVMLAYQVYRYTRNTNYVLREITQMMEQTKEGIPPQQQMPYESEDSYRQEPHYDDWDSISYTSPSPVEKQEEPKSENHTANVNTEKRDLKKAQDGTKFLFMNGDFYLTKDYLHFSYSRAHRKFDCIYSLSTGKLISFGKKYGFFPLFFANIIGSTEDAFIGYMFPIMVTNDVAAWKSLPYDSLVKQFGRARTDLGLSMQKEDNPIITFFYPKQF